MIIFQLKKEWLSTQRKHPGSDFHSIYGHLFTPVISLIRARFQSSTCKVHTLCSRSHSQFPMQQTSSSQDLTLWTYLPIYLQSYWWQLPGWRILQLQQLETLQKVQTVLTWNTKNSITGNLNITSHIASSLHCIVLLITQLPAASSHFLFFSLDIYFWQRGKVCFSSFTKSIPAIAKQSHYLKLNTVSLSFWIPSHKKKRNKNINCHNASILKFRITPSWI